MPWPASIHLHCEHLSLEHHLKIPTKSYITTFWSNPSWGPHNPTGTDVKQKALSFKTIPRPQGSPVSCLRSMGVDQLASICLFCSLGKNYMSTSPLAGQNIFSNHCIKIIRNSEGRRCCLSFPLNFLENKTCTIKSRSLAPLARSLLIRRKL